MTIEQPALAERCGLWVGAGLAPLTAAVSRARHARMFHPEGVVVRASTEPCAADPELRRVAERLAGPTLARFSSALWRGREWPDVLGAALRFGWDGEAGTQDLLLATIRFPWTMLLAPLATNYRSFLWNHYHAVSPFHVPGVGPAKLRLRSPRLSNGTESTRRQHFENAMRAGRAVFRLELRHLDVSALRRRWQPLAEITLLAPVDVDQGALRFSPFNDAAGLRPTGFVHAMRLAAYAASQRARPASEGASSGW
ncbi:MAG: hypothetical protein EOO73_06920 [Myxococcales bacterium]|nr:MAG: hypothetical protein EOO73_06920 [Myxococcales bacterium]